MPNDRMRTYPLAKVEDVHDGDTMKVVVDLGFSVLTRQWIRLLDVRAPELKESNGPAARQDVLNWMSTCAPDGYVSVVTYQTAGDVKEINEKRTFIRYVGMIIGKDGQVLNAHMRDLGYTDQGE